MALSKEGVRRLQEEAEAAEGGGGFIELEPLSISLSLSLSLSPAAALGSFREMTARQGEGIRVLRPQPKGRKAPA